ncbi:MAG: universal stress protein [Zavarzinella sp.]|nr:universal stress protein [Zavarzinella sp.]
MKRIRTILHPTDFSPGSDVAFRYACDLAQDYDAKVLVVYAQGPVIPFGADGVVISPDMDELRAVAEQQLAGIRPADSAVRLERVYRDGPAAGVILDVAAEAKADLIVMGTHGRTGIGRLFLGSVAEEVLRKAPCPVLTVKATAPPATNKPAGKAKAAAAAGV